MPTNWSFVSASGYTNPDTFTRANSATAGNGWLATGTNAFSIASNQLVIGNSNSKLYRPSAEASQSQRHVVRFVNSGLFVMNCVRYDSSTNNSYFVMCGPAGDTTVHLIKQVAGSFIDVGTAISTSGFVVGKTYEIDLAAENTNPTTLTVSVTNVTDSVVLVNAVARTDSESVLQVGTGVPAISIFSGTNGVATYSATYAISAATPITPNFVFAGSSGNTLTLTGSGFTAGTPGSPTFTTSAGTITAQTVISATSATLTFTAPSQSGLVTITAGSFTYTLNVLLPANSSNIISSPYNSEFNGSSWVQSNTPGWYQRFKLTGATAIYATVDVSALIAQGATSGQYPRMRAIVNNQLTCDVQLTNTGGEITLATGLTGTPEVFLYYNASGSGFMDRWSASGNNSLRIVGYRTDGQVTTLTPRPRRSLILGDSITEGSGTQNALEQYAPLIGVALNSEYGQIGFGAQSWVGGGAGNVPVFGTSWSLQRAGVSRNVTTPQPDYVIIHQGTNDGLISSSDATVTANAISTLQAMRTAMPNAWIFLIIPFGQYKQSALASAVSTVNDRKTVLIDLGVEASRGLTSISLPPSIYASDGTHPSTYASGRIATMLAAAIQAKISAVATGRRSLKL